MLELERLTARAGGDTLVRDISLRIGAGERVAIVGASGSGKSLTARAMLALPPAGVRYTGTVRIDGRELLGMPDREVARLRGAVVSMVFQEPATALNPVKRIGSQIDEAIRLHTDTPSRERARMVMELLDRTGLTDAGVGPERYPHQLSGGQRQRVAIAIAVALSPRLVVADEPTSALDAVTSLRVLDLLERLTAERGTALVLITHDLSVARRAGRVVVMADGAIAEEGADALTHPRSEAGRALAASRVVTLPPRPDAAPRAPVLEAENIRVARGGRAIVKGVSFAVEPGERIALVGGSGSGKTTLVRAMLGLLPMEGALTLAGTPVAPGSPILRRDAQMVFQDPATSFNPRHTVLRIVTEPLHATTLSRAERRARAVEALERVGLPPEALQRRPHAFSGGQRQRIAIARALVAGPKVLLADEPVSALDAALRGQIVALFDRLSREDSLALVFIAHDLALVRTLADRIMVMDDGVVVEEGTPEEIFERPQHPSTKALVEEADDVP
ncbi:microcin ABC transporter ATP-binding protein [Acuticoccus sediminis]|uniref:Microcin ABC transporter ATP-binding protein n=1 Tax=Acuticoccus sediminis TaxID=2184697 RepID=A0A8B2NWE0_9HYPH|nr:ABC transporter ATP-binding protein [Acuticoccus sediminis]RAI02990.1 microcin ABC transporter ATP-binding protein [Acuticoccus sediminis]